MSTTIEYGTILVWVCASRGLGRSGELGIALKSGRDMIWIYSPKKIQTCPDFRKIACGFAHIPIGIEDVIRKQRLKVLHHCQERCIKIDNG